MPSHADADEAELVRLARRGQEAAFAELYRRHARAVHALAFRLTGNAAAAEDITQDCFLKLLQFLGRLHRGAPLRPWLKRVAANAAIDRIRRERRYPDAGDETEPAAPDAGPSLHAEALGALRRLSPAVRTLVWLHTMEGWSHRELGRRFGRSESCSKSAIARALGQLRGEIEEETPHGDD